MTATRTRTLNAEREQPANRPTRITPAIVSAVRWLHGDTAADELIRKAMAR